PLPSSLPLPYTTLFRSVHGRKRQDFDFVLDFRDTLEAANPGFGIRLESWPGHLPAENHRVIRKHFGFKPIKDVVVRQSNELMAHFVRYQGRRMATMHAGARHLLLAVHTA